MKIIFPCRNSWKIVFVHLISNENDLFSICSKSSNTIKISFAEMSFAKMKLIPFNLSAIVFHIQEPMSNSLTASFLQRILVMSERLIGCWEKECLWMWVIGVVSQLFLMQHSTTELTSSNEGADVNRQDRYNKDTPLQFAAQYNKTESVRLLLDNGADINLKNDDNKTPLDVARKGSKIESMLLQLQQSAP